MYERIYGYTKRATVANYYRRERDHWGRDRHAVSAFQFAKHLVEIDALQDAAGPTEYPGYPDALSVFPFGDFEVCVYADDEPYDWGDDEPTEEERANLEVIGVAVRIAGDDQDLDSIWGCAYDGRTENDPDRFALSTAIQYGFIDAAHAEVAEREHLRGYVETVA